ncbi:uncharacterized protein LOC130778926 [Actinidia eriantha]|uniref:uncharacterized protein LOC130778926 n=1 Tax=Actinidia eriantha TaxID=165200 RepID=UPI00258EADA0|nr:uncharacterized protein LOC130778926 [Actinidia eriantha]
MELSTGSKVWGVVVLLLGLLVVVAEQATTKPQSGAYACWGGCDNECNLQNGKTTTQRMPCYWNCLGNCIPNSASDYQYYCRFGCSLAQCIRYSSDGGKVER